MKVAMVIAVLGLAGSSAANAACTWKWDCSTGTCRQVSVCENAIDMPPLKPLELPPLVMPGIAPIPSPTLPPIGTRQCSPRYLCNSYGQCSWQTVCN